jgi:hypothetical protein
MNSRVLLLLLCLPWVCPVLRADEFDVVVDYKGEAIPAKVIRFEDNVFTLSTSNGVRTLPVEEVTSIFFDLNKPLDEAPRHDTRVPKEPEQVPPPVLRPEPRPSPEPRSEPAPEPEAGGRFKRPAHVPPPYGNVESSLLADEVKSAGAVLKGKVVKVEFHFRGAMRPLPAGGHFVSLHTAGDWAGLWVLIDDEAAPWFRQVPERPAYLDRGYQKARGFYVYGVVVEAPPEWAMHQVMMGAQPPGATSYTLQPIGRKTQRGLRGALEYGW